MLGTKVKALRLFLKIKCYITEKARAIIIIFLNKIIIIPLSLEKLVKK
jgi:hypothetical protein